MDQGMVTRAVFAKFAQLLELFLQSKCQISNHGTHTWGSTLK